MNILLRTNKAFRGPYTDDRAPDPGETVTQITDTQYADYSALTDASKLILFDPGFRYATQAEQDAINGPKVYQVLQSYLNNPASTFVTLSATQIPGLIRLMREVSTSDTLLSTDGGIICSGAGSTITLSAYTAAQSGLQYAIKNASSGNITIATTGAEKLQMADGNVSSLTIPTDCALAIIRNASNTANWIIQ